MFIKIFNNFVPLSTDYAPVDLYEFLQLLLSSLENEFVVDMSRAPFIDLTSVYFDHKRVDINAFLMSIADVPSDAHGLLKLYAVADDITTLEMQTCEGAVYPNFHIFRLKPFAVDVARVDIQRVLILLDHYFPELKERKIHVQL